MKQILQNMGSGETSLMEIPAPATASGALLIATSRSLISAGTERMLVDFGRASLIEKARQQPDKVKMVLDKVKTEGLLTTIDAVKSKLDQPLPLGYCNVGRVLEVGRGVDGFAPGDRVVSNGSHAELVRVPRNLCAKVPDQVSDECAAFTVLAAIGLQGIRLAAPTLGEYVVVTGLGLIGLITVQLLRSSGCHVLGIDFDENKLALARQFGAVTCNPGRGEDPVAAGLAISGGHGVDAVIITASTQSSDPVSQAARMSRKRGRIVLVGVTGLELNRAEFYEKELTFQVSCSYGPGRYDPAYEQDGRDYPYGLVRWTEQRNFEAILSMLADGRLDVRPLISNRFAFENALDAYDVLTRDKAALGIVLEYPPVVSAEVLSRRVILRGESMPSAAGEPVLGFIGAGNYASRMLIPAFVQAGVALDTIVTTGGANGVHHGRKAGFRVASSDDTDVFANPAINTVAIVTRHGSHAGFVLKALAAGKHVFVEKPLALKLEELEHIEAAYRERLDAGTVQHLMVGFNRRFSPLVQTMKTLLAPVVSPKAFIYTCSAGAIPKDHWTHDLDSGGGRIVGEACHFVDLLRHLAGCPIIESTILSMGRHPAVAVSDDKAIINLKFADGSIGTIQYLANGGKRFPKERIEVFANDAVLQLDNFLSLRGFDWPGFNKQKLWKQDKGQAACALAFAQAVRDGKPAPIPIDELLEVSRVSIELAMLQRSNP